MICKKGFYTEKISNWNLLLVPVCIALCFISSSFVTTFLIIPITMLTFFGLLGSVVNAFWGEKGVLILAAILTPFTIAMMVMSFIDGMETGILQAL